MSWKTELNGYVKFLRGTPAAWADLAVKDSDTLYFISDTNDTKGKLYLGSKLISDGSITQISSISDLQDVLISAGIPNNAVLVYNTTTQKWESQPIQYVLSTIVAPMVGASADADGSAGLVPTPLQGQQNLYLQANGTWSDPASSVRSDLAALRGADSSGTVRSIAADVVAGVIDNAPSSFDTLKEIADWIAVHDGAIDIVEITNDVADLNEAVFGTGNNDGLVNDVSSLDVIINGTQETAGLTTIVNNLQGNYADLSATVNGLGVRTTNLETSVTAIDNKLKWQDLVYEED